MSTAPRTPALQSAGVLVFRRLGGLELLLGHMGGPFWARKQDGAWSVPKGLLEPGEDAMTAARREFTEETGLPLPEGALLPLGDVRTAAGKTVTVWALEADPEVDAFSPGTFPLEWPPRSGRTIQVPEIDVLRWVAADEAVALLTTAQRPLVARLSAMLGAD
ncbi:MAG TPA: NUDIX domain-containing protein [Amnibacterium sp.]|jgi:predicted NUDIX family NTP pyrophosphohydrolase|uniref:NUDIX domain-containing protein n=1 Tax=Amnibacterium sp. TaxID=1872496 RepID=UPI002F93DEDE